MCLALTQASGEQKESDIEENAPVRSRLSPKRRCPRPLVDCRHAVLSCASSLTCASALAYTQVLDENANLRRAIFNLILLTPYKAFKPRCASIRDDWCQQVNKLDKSRPLTEEDFAEVHTLLVMVQSSIKPDAIAPWFHEMRWRQRIQHASDVHAYVSMAICLYSALVGGNGPVWMLA